MATLLAPALSGLPEDVRPIRAGEFPHMVGAGLFGDDNVELLVEAILLVPQERGEHAAPIRRLTSLLVVALHPRFEVAVNAFLLVDEISVPKPDLYVVPAGSFPTNLPDDTPFAVEVSLSSHRRDLGEKARRYALEGIGEYWVVDVPGRSIILHRDAEGDRWTHTERGGEGQTVTVVGLPEVTADVSALFEGVPPV